MALSDDFINYLKKKARRVYFGEGNDEDPVIYDYCGGNVDDAYQMGVDDGETQAARGVLEALGIGWK